MLVSRSIHAAAKGIISFLKCLSSIPLCVCIGTYNIFFTHSSVDGHLGCFHALGIVSCAVVNIEVHESFQGIGFCLFVCFFFPNICSGLELSDHMEILFLFF